MAELDHLITEQVGPPGDRPDAPPIQPPPATDPDGGWQTSKANGRQYYNPTPGKRGPRVIYRHGDETVAQAIDRDRREQQETARDRRPHKKPKRPPMPDPPRAPDLKELENTLAEALKAPAMLCASFGDEWAAEHFTRSGPYLARNLILAADHNPWLRRKLEEAATGEDAMMMVVSLVGVGGALFAYIAPPVIWFLNVPVPNKTRELFGIPDRRREQRPAYAADQSPEGAEPPAWAEAA